RVDRARGSDGGVDPATHRCQNFHAYQSKRDTCAHPARTKTKENLPAIRPFLPRRMLSGRFSFVLVALLGDVVECLLHGAEPGIDAVESGDELLVDLGVLLERVGQLGLAAVERAD